MTRDYHQAMCAGGWQHREGVSLNYHKVDKAGCRPIMLKVEVRGRGRDHCVSALRTRLRTAHESTLRGYDRLEGYDVDIFFAIGGRGHIHCSLYNNCMSLSHAELHGVILPVPC